MSDQDQKNIEDDVEFAVKKLSPFFIDEIANISISPNGACRLQFITWQTGDDGKALRVDSEVILTIQSLKLLSDSLPKAIEQSNKMMSQRMSSPEIKDGLQ